MSSEHSRREFLKTVATGAATVAAATCVFGSTGCGVNAPPSAPGPRVDKAGQLVFAPNKFPQVARVGGAVSIVPESLVEGKEEPPVLFMRVSDTEYRATSGLCTHVLCPVNYDPQNRVIECPCHGARFGLDGKVLRKPANAPLKAYPVRTDPTTGEFVIDTRGSNMPILEEDGRVRFEYNFFPELEGYEVAFAFTPTGVPEPLIVLRYESNRYFTYPAYSTASRTILEYDKQTRRLFDPSEGIRRAEFDIDGKVKLGPPGTTDLTLYPTRLEGTVVVIDYAVPE